jgi:RNA-binding protein 8A
MASLEIDVSSAASGKGSARLRTKGRGHRDRTDGNDSELSRGTFDSTASSGAGPVKSVEGWIVFVWNVHEEAQEEDILDAFGEYGDVRNIHVNLDRRTGFVKGYVLIEYAERKEADAAIKAMNGADMLGQTLGCDFAFREGPRTRRS